jgi:hypothetical protein
MTTPNPAPILVPILQFFIVFLSLPVTFAVAFKIRVAALLGAPPLDVRGTIR